MNHRRRRFYQHRPIPVWTKCKCRRINPSVRRKITGAEIISTIINRLLTSRNTPHFLIAHDGIGPHSESPIVESNPAPWYPGVFGQSRSEFQFDENQRFFHSHVAEKRPLPVE
jgi:hypothetical protein